MARGIGDEKRIEDSKLFELLKKIASKHAKELDLGGNASTMAVRAFLEGCKLRIGFPLNQEYFDTYFKKESNRVEIAGGLREINDYHISLNYYMTDKYWNISVPRSNRIFLNKDEDNNHMTALDDFFENISDIDIIAISGTQLPSDYELFVKKLKQIRNVLSLPNNAGKQVHLESSAFTNQTFYDTQLDILLKRVNSNKRGRFFGHE